jgi:hypothetical protein
MKQTAVEWLVEKMIERKFFAKDLPLSYTTLEHLTNQAKEMEKQQIVDAHGNQTKKFGGISNHIYILTGEEYYNKTFNK